MTAYFGEAHFSEGNRPLFAFASYNCGPGNVARARKEARIETGDVVNVLPEGDGRLVLVRMERPKPQPRNKVRIIRRKGKHSLLSIGRPISREEVFKALEQFPP